MRGLADLVLETEAGLVLVDHKCFAVEAGREGAVAREYAGQLEAYAEALERPTGRRVVGRFVHLPIAGIVVELQTGRA